MAITTKNTVYDRIASDFIQSDKELAGAFVPTKRATQATPFLDYQRQKQQYTPPPEPPPETEPNPPSTDTFVKDYFQKRGWDIDRKPLVLAAPSTASNVDQWNGIVNTGGNQAMVALNKVWYSGEALTPQEDTLLKSLFARYPMGQTDYNTWLKQTVRQVWDDKILPGLINK